MRNLEMSLGFILFVSSGCTSQGGGGGSGGADADADSDSDSDDCRSPDADADGHARTLCGGDDCDDDAAAVHPGATDWQVQAETVAQAGGAEEPSLAIGPDGSIRVAWVDDAGLQLATGPAWSVENLDPESVGAASLAIAPDGSVGVAHFVPSLSHAGGHEVVLTSDVTGAWQRERVWPNGADPASVDLALDADGIAHLAFRALPDFGGWRGLAYANDAGGSFVITLPDPDTTSGHGAAIATAQDGTVHIAYRAADPFPTLRHAWRGEGFGARWSVETVDDAVDTGRRVSLVVAVDGDPSVAYWGGETSDLRLATRAGGAWTAQTVEATWRGGESVSLAMDDDGAAHVAYLDDVLRYGTTAGGDWELTTVEDGGQGGVSLAIDADGVVHVAWVDDQKVRHAVFSGTPDGVDADCDGGPEGTCGARDADLDSHESIACGGDDCDDGNGGVHPGAIEQPGEDKTCDGREGVDEDGDGHASTATDGDDCDDGDATVHAGAAVVSCDEIDQDCVGGDETDADFDGHLCPGAGGDDCDDDDAAAHPGAAETPCDDVDQDCDGWDVVDADGDGHACEAAGGGDCDDGDAAVHPGAQDLACDDVDQDCDGRDPTDVDGDGHEPPGCGGDDCDDGDAAVHPGAEEGAPDPEVVGDEVVAGEGWAIALDAAEDVHVAYGVWDAGRVDLSYATNASGEWVARSVADGGDFEHPSIFVEADGDVHLAWAEQDAGDVWYAFDEGAGFSASILESAAIYVGPTGVAVDADDVVHVVYQDLGAGDLRYARNAGAGWTFELAASAGSTGNDAAIALAPDGTVHVATHDDDELFHAIRDGGAWVAEPVVDPGLPDVTSLFVDADGTVHIAYVDQREDDVLYATDATGVWRSEVVGTGAEPVDVSLAVDDRGTIHVAWSVWRWGDITSSVRYAADTGAGFVEETIDADASFRTHVAIAEKGGDAHLVWGADAGLVHASFTPPDGIDTDCDGVVW